MSISIADLNSQQIDVLKEIGNIGAGNAVTALSKMVSKRIDMKVPIVNIVEFKEVADLVGGPEMLVSGIYFKVSGDITGSIMFLIDNDSSRTLINWLMGKNETNAELDEIELSALKEVGNILAGSYLSSLSTLTGLSMTVSIPSLAIDMAGAIMSVPVILFGQVGDHVLLIETDFIEGINQVKGNFFLIPDEQSFEILLKSLGVI
ncbi:CheY-P phosphatase CheC [bioreactor metagenome]|jgi:chemotaxis protein CheC|uniref:CheY-P phosphatase CheC n=1 Tax=bioreactor metagenome TaxID=1076179 RepID=A0A645AUX4_9ZZZZ|nr:chemotaxis protein CheC [Lutispora sp.]MEA4962741.1 chemotaxis protein CheC [Lutispora sp.]HCJ56419.1 CheY-P-specific phosphatase CheC [Clostridiaceae bacterium]